MPPARRSVLASGGVPIRRICAGVLGSTVGSWLAGIRRPVLAVPPPGPELAWSGPGGWVLAYVSGIEVLLSARARLPAHGCAGSECSRWLAGRWRLGGQAVGLPARGGRQRLCRRL